MARKPGNNGGGRDPQETPSEFPETTPRELHPTSDIRFVMHEVGRLTANVERLIADVQAQGSKIDELRQQASYIKGGMAVAVILIGAFIWIASTFLSAKWDAAVAVLRALDK